MSYILALFSGSNTVKRNTVNYANIDLHLLQVCMVYVINDYGTMIRVSDFFYYNITVV